MLLLRYLAVLTVVTTTAHCRNAESGPSARGNGGGWAPARVAEVYFTTEVAGYIEPCGCTTKPLGGLPRLATVIRRGIEARTLVDAGHLLFPPKGVDDVTREQHLLKAGLLARAYRRLGVTAMNVAAADLTEGASLLKRLQHQGATPFVSANVRPVGGHGPEVARSFIRNVGAIKIGITGVTTPESVSGVEGMTAIEYAPAVTVETRALRDSGADVIVVLAHMSELAARELAEIVPDIDIVLRAPGTSVESAPKPPIQVGRTVIAEAGSQGQHVGRVTIALGSERPTGPLVLDDGDRTIRRKRALLKRKIRAFRTEVQAWQSDPAKAAAVRAKKSIIARLEARLAEPAPPTRPPDKPYLRVDQIPLDDEVPADPDLSAALKSYYSRLRAMNADKGDPTRCRPVEGQPTYVGTKACVECHAEAYAFWKKTKHALAWETLEAGSKQYDLTCVGCHVVGYQKPGGFCRIKDVSGFEDVGCENCHGPGSKHITDGDPSSIVLQATVGTCANECHVPEHSDAFDFPKYLRMVTGPGHALDKD